MNLVSHIRESISNIMNSKAQSFLAILGVLVGTGSVVALISTSQLATEHALSQFKTLGTNLLSVSITQEDRQNDSSRTRNLLLRDIPGMKKSAPQVVLASPYVSTYQSMRFNGKELNGGIIGATENFSDIAKINMESGRFVSYLDRASFYCVIGAKLAKQIRKDGFEPVGQQINIGKYMFTIIGVAKPWKSNLFIYADIDSGVIVPLQSTYLISKYAKISNVLFRLVRNPDIDKAQNNLTRYLKRILPGQRFDFHNPQQIINIIGKQRATFSWLLIAIGAISLVVGAIGVMNIMLVSVIERRHEIGIRMAIGAQRNEILIMFLIESVVLTLIGGILGIASGVCISFIIAIVSKWQFQFYLVPPLLGFVVSVIVGIVSGIYPGYRASRLDPVQTLYGE